MPGWTALPDSAAHPRTDDATDKDLSDLVSEMEMMKMIEGEMLEVLRAQK